MQYRPMGVCSRQINVELDGDTIKSVEFVGQKIPPERHICHSGGFFCFEETVRAWPVRCARRESRPAESAGRLPRLPFPGRAPLPAEILTRSINEFVDYGKSLIYSENLLKSYKEYSECVYNNRVVNRYWYLRNAISCKRQFLIAPCPLSLIYGDSNEFYNMIVDLFTVHEHVFNPPPKVKSAVIRMTRNETQDLGCNEKLFKQIVKTTFNQRRKTLRNSISPILDKNSPLSADPLFNKRPEQLSVEDFIELTNRVEKALADTPSEVKRE